MNEPIIGDYHCLRCLKIMVKGDDVYDLGNEDYACWPCAMKDHVKLNICKTCENNIDVETGNCGCPVIMIRSYIESLHDDKTIGYETYRASYIENAAKYLEEENVISLITIGDEDHYYTEYRDGPYGNERRVYIVKSSQRKQLSVILVRICVEILCAICKANAIDFCKICEHGVCEGCAIPIGDGELFLCERCIGVVTEEDVPNQ